MPRRPQTLTDLLLSGLLLTALPLPGCGGEDDPNAGEPALAPSGPIEASWFRHFENPGFAFAFGFRQHLERRFFQLFVVVQVVPQLAEPGHHAHELCRDRMFAFFADNDAEFFLQNRSE